MIEKRVIQELVNQYFADKDLTLVNIKVNNANNIKIFFKADSRSVTIDDCAGLNRFLEDNLDREKEDFSLMVSSAGDNDSNGDDKSDL